MDLDVARPAGGAPAGGGTDERVRARLEVGPWGWTVELRDLPDDAELAVAIGKELLDLALEAVAAAGGGRVHLWARAQDAVRTEIAQAAGLSPTRDLWQMRRDLPVGEPWSLPVRPFVPGQDEEAWLAVNNRAFAWHPEQGHRTLAELRALEAEPWFDPAGFLLHEVDGRLAGFCWTKVHADEEPPLGEIYVIAVDPAAAGRGLGRRVVLAGLDHLHRRGLRCGMLYVEATNEPATRLYRDLGFALHQVDTAYSRHVAAR